MKWVPGGPERRARAQLVVVVVLAMIASAVLIVPALASHGLASLSGSTFEIDDNANLKQDHDGTTDPAMDDWATLAEATVFDPPNAPEIRAIDLPTGQSDNAYKGGVKEDTECPAETTGTIPNNKSDLLTFHVYEEDGDPGFLNLAWSRVSEPSGTTLMDFEFNQSTTPCAQGPNVVRTDGDLLIEYAIDQGGARASITGRYWDGTAGEWGPIVNLSDQDCGGNPCAVGTINQTAIPAAESDGLIDSGQKSARTFGEAQIDLDLIFNSSACTSFGSAMLKSRSSTSFTSQLKDFIAPVPITLSNCGRVIVKKITDPSSDAQDFHYTTVIDRDDNDSNPSDDDNPAFDLDTDGSDSTLSDTKTITNVISGTGYSVTEVVPTGWDLTALTCTVPDGDDAGTDPDPAPGFSPSGSTATFNVPPDTTVTCTYTNTKRGSVKIIKNAIPDDGQDFTFTTTDEGPTGTPINGGSSFMLDDDNDGTLPSNQTFNNLKPGTYTVTEGLVSGWDLTGLSCSDSDTSGTDSSEDLGTRKATINLDPGELVTCTYTNTARGSITITKTDDAGNVLEGVTFSLWNEGGADDTTFDGLGDPPNDDTDTGTDCTTDSSGQCSFTNLVPGTYWVVEDAPPTGYSGADPVKAVVGAGQDVSLDLENPRLHKAILLVCHTGTNTLAPSAWALGSDVAQNPLTTIGQSDLSGTALEGLLADGVTLGQLESALCGLQGFDNLDHGEQEFVADIGSDAHPE